MVVIVIIWQQCCANCFLWTAIAMDGRFSSAFHPEKTNPRSVFLNAHKNLGKGLLCIAFREDIKERSDQHCIPRR